MPGGVDLHTHTTASDGTYAPRELVAEASDRGVRVLAITDHDSTEGLAEALEEAERRRPLEILPGIEINCDVEGAEIHVLGYLMDWQAPWFQEFCREQRRGRRGRVHRPGGRGGRRRLRHPPPGAVCHREGGRGGGGPRTRPRG